MASYVANNRIRTQANDKDGSKLIFAPGDQVKGVRKDLLERLVELGAVSEELASKPEPEPETTEAQ